VSFADRGGRNIYLDLGANWANTMRLYKDFASERVGPWEVYAFEASPLIQPYLEEFTKFLNGAGPRPPLTIPPSGSSAHLALFAPRYGCPTEWGVLQQCMFDVFREPLSQLKPDPSLNNLALIRQRMAEATRPLQPGQADRFTSIPAAVGDADGTLQLGLVDANQMIRGGAHSHGVGQNMGVRMTVPMVDLVTWITNSFTEADFVMVKMDVEGAEFGIVNRLIDLGGAGRVKRMALECHKPIGDCVALQARLQHETTIEVFHEGQRGYVGFDSLSTPEKYFPQDPRQVHSLAENGTASHRA